MSNNNLLSTIIKQPKITDQPVLLNINIDFHCSKLFLIFLIKNVKKQLLLLNLKITIWYEIDQCFSTGAGGRGGGGNWDY